MTGLPGETGTSPDSPCRLARCRRDSRPSLRLVRLAPGRQESCASSGSLLEASTGSASSESLLRRLSRDPSEASDSADLSASLSSLRFGERSSASFGTGTSSPDRSLRQASDSGQAATPRSLPSLRETRRRKTGAAVSAFPVSLARALRLTVPIPPVPAGIDGLLPPIASCGYFPCGKYAQNRNLRRPLAEAKTTPCAVWAERKRGDGCGHFPSGNKAQRRITAAVLGLRPQTALHRLGQKERGPKPGSAAGLGNCISQNPALRRFGPRGIERVALMHMKRPRRL